MSSSRRRRRKSTQRQCWRWLQSKESAGYRSFLTRTFNRLFPKGHKTSLRGWVRLIQRLVKKGVKFEGKYSPLRLLDVVHPEAFSILLRYGKDYTPVVSGPHPEPKANKCLQNSWVLALLDEEDPRRTRDRPPFEVVEGIVSGVMVLPMLHAWNTLGVEGETAVDWTQYSVCRYSRYLGIALTLKERQRLERLTPLGERHSFLFHKKYFTERMAKELVKILEARKR